MSDLTLRSATADDAAAIAEIYNFYVATSAATFDTELKSVDERIAWLEMHGESHPVLVAERDGSIVGWGSLSRWGTRAAYEHTVEISVYVHAETRGSGVGRALTLALVDAAREAGHRAIIAQIVAENAPSLSMSAACGFEVVGRLTDVGRKFDRWLDVVLMELVLHPENEDPSE